MPYLYCEEHGKAKYEEALKTDWQYPGEYMKIAYGKTTGNHICDQCNAQIRAGNIAYFVGFYLTSHKDQTEYDYFESPEIHVFKEREDDTLTITPITDDNIDNVTKHLFKEIE